MPAAPAATGDRLLNIFEWVIFNEIQSKYRQQPQKMIGLEAGFAFRIEGQYTERKFKWNVSELSVDGRIVSETSLGTLFLTGSFEINQWM